MIKNHEVYHPLYNDKDHFIILVTGGRGCEHPDQKVMMADFSVKKIKDIRIGDLVMGDDYTPRTVLYTCKGHSNMFRVRQKWGDDYFVNETHILTLMGDGCNMHDIPLQEYLAMSPTERRNWGGCRVLLEENEIIYQVQNISVEPIGDGDWCGIMLDGNHRYLHSDGTVTHNSGKSFGVGTFAERLTFEVKKRGLPDGTAERLVHNILYTRYTMASAAISVIPEFLEKVELDGTQQYFHATKTDITNMYTGAKIMFRGIKTSSGNQTAKLKSIHGITTFICDEAEEWTSEREFETISLSIRQQGIQNRVIVIMNPTDSNHFIYQKYLKDTHRLEYYDGFPVQISTHPNVLHIHTTWLDNKENLSEEFVKSAIDMKERNPERYAHIFMGHWDDVAEGAVFKNWGIVNEFPENAKKVARGLDFGYSQDPSACVRCGIVGNDLYLDEQFYETGMGLKQLISTLSQDGDFVYADSADPRLIDEIALGGVIIYPVSKPAGSIIAGIEKMKSFDNIFVTKRSINLQEELRNYVWAQDKFGNYINTPEDKFNHCFTADTLITTNRGCIPMGEIKVGDKVATSNGYREVQKKFNNGRKKIICVRLSFGRFSIELKGTSDHKIKTDRGWIKLQDLKVGDALFLCKNSTARHTIYTKEKDITHEDAIVCTQMYGNSITEKSPKVSTSTTLMGIPKTTLLRIWNFLMGQNIAHCICKHLLKARAAFRFSGGEWIMPESLLPNGTVLLMDSNGIGDTVKRPQEKLNNRSSSANGVEIPLCQSPTERTDFAVMDAGQKRDTTLALIMKCAYASNVETNSSQTNTLAPNTVQEDAVGYIVQKQEIIAIEILKEDFANVYDLQVEETHEYFANGILVHNCIDAVRYYITGCILGKIVKPKNVRKSDLGIF